jgi:hypothetical protein
MGLVDADGSTHQERMLAHLEGAIGSVQRALTINARLAWHATHAADAQDALLLCEEELALLEVQRDDILAGAMSTVEGRRRFAQAAELLAALYRRQERIDARRRLRRQDRGLLRPHAT